MYNLTRGLQNNGEWVLVVNYSQVVCQCSWCWQCYLPLYWTMWCPHTHDEKTIWGSPLNAGVSPRYRSSSPRKISLMTPHQKALYWSSWCISTALLPDCWRLFLPSFLPKSLGSIVVVAISGSQPIFMSVLQKLSKVVRLKEPFSKRFLFC